MIIGIYFSGTGNSRYCLDYFLKCYCNNYKIFSVEELNSNKELINEISNYENIFISYPVYFSSVPRILMEFVKSSVNIFNNKKVFIIATMYMFSGDGAGVLARELKKYKANIIGTLHLKMPDNISDEKIVYKTIKNNAEIIRKTKLKIEKTSNALKKGKYPNDGIGFISFLLGFLSQRAWFGNKDLSGRLKIDEAKCIIGCGKCVKLCPMKNLHLCDDNKKACANHNCTLCYKCVNECPAKAITLFGKKVRFQYKINDCLKLL